MSQRTKVDWLAGRTKAEPADLLPAIAPAFSCPPEWLNLARRSAGWMGYESSCDLRVADMNAGLVAWGGDHQRGWCHLSLTGQGCDWVRDWDVAQDALHGLAGWEARRVDIALDTFKREGSHDLTLAAYRAGGFTTSGRPPKMRQITSDDPLEGRTIYVGTRSSEKFFRGYEKGLQLAGGAPGVEFDGVPAEDWYRLELEIKAKSAPLPEDLIDRRDQYFAGAYPYLQTLLADVEPEIMVNLRERAPQIDLAAALDNIRTQYGRTIFTALVAYDGDMGAVMARIRGSEHNVDLLRAGVLLVEHAS